MNEFRNLPHWDLIGHYQFVTFRTNDSVDDFLLKISNDEKCNSVKQAKIDNYLDSSSKGAYLNGKVLDFLKEFFISKNNILYELVVFCIMPNHVHLLFNQIEDLTRIMKLLKGGSSLAINKILLKQGRFWEKDYYDRLIRNENHFLQTYNYICNNPQKLPDKNKRLFTFMEVGL